MFAIFSDYVYIIKSLMNVSYHSEKFLKHSPPPLCEDLPAAGIADRAGAALAPGTVAAAAGGVVPCRVVGHSLVEG